MIGASGGPAVSSIYAGPLEWLCLDIETVAGRPESAEEWARRFWCPDERWAPETIGKRYLEALRKKREKLALLDSAGIAVIAIRDSSQHRPVTVTHACGQQAPEFRDWGLIGGYADERELLKRFREFLNQHTDEGTLLVGHNIRAFDLPRLRFAYLRNGLQLPGLLASPEVRVFDSMNEFARRFSVEREEFISLATVLQKIGMPNHKEVMDGSEIGELLAEVGRETRDGGRGPEAASRLSPLAARPALEAVLKYAALDVLCESEVFLRLTGRSVQLA